MLSSEQSIDHSAEAFSKQSRITLLACSFYGCDSEYWPVIIDRELAR